MDGAVPQKKYAGFGVKQLVPFLLALAFAGQVHTVSATPAAPVVLVNPASRQCIEHVILADECRVCRPVEGWEISQTGQCPSGYEIIARQAVMDSELPLTCTEYPKNEWASCSWGRYPTMTPEFSAVTAIPALTVTVQQPTGYTPAISATPSSPEVAGYSFNALFVFCVGGIAGIIMAGILLMMIRRKKIFPANKSK